VIPIGGPTAKKKRSSAGENYNMPTGRLGKWEICVFPLTLLIMDVSTNVTSHLFCEFVADSLDRGAGGVTAVGANVDTNLVSDHTQTVSDFLRRMGWGWLFRPSYYSYLR
jgi:hypothetical protein